MFLSTNILPSKLNESYGSLHGNIFYLTHQIWKNLEIHVPVMLDSCEIIS
jgi:hypothetical protein